jgi:hypothetical protein
MTKEILVVAMITTTLGLYGDMEGIFYHFPIPYSNAISTLQHMK